MSKENFLKFTNLIRKYVEKLHKIAQALDMEIDDMLLSDNYMSTFLNELTELVISLYSESYPETNADEWIIDFCDLVVGGIDVNTKEIFEEDFEDFYSKYFKTE